MIRLAVVLVLALGLGAVARAAVETAAALHHVLGEREARDVGP